MPSTFVALAVTALAVLPGGLYTWAFERDVGRWGAGVADRVLRLIGVSAAFLAVLAWPAYLLWTNYLHRPEVVDGRVVGYRNLVFEGAILPWWLFLVPVAYVALPIAAGLLAGAAVRKRREGASALWRLMALAAAGRDPAPRAWDHVFLAAPAAVVRIRLREGGWVGGRFGERSYAAGYREAPEDLYLQETYLIDEDGNFTAGDAPGGFAALGSSLLITREEIRHIEFFAEQPGPAA